MTTDLIRDNPEPAERVVPKGPVIQRIEWILLAWAILTGCLFIFLTYMHGLLQPLLVILVQGLAILFTGQLGLDGPQRFWDDLGLALTGNLLYFATGLWYIFRRNVEIPRAAWLPVSYALGLGLLTFPLEILAIFKLLSFASVLGTVIMTWAMLYFLTKEETLDERRRASEEFRRWLETIPGLLRGKWKEFRWKGGASRHENVVELMVWWAGLLLIVLMCLLTFYYAIFFPVIYTDALMYYVDYGWRTYQEHGFPEVVCAQVGIGLGANYPHLYPLAQATQAFLFKHYTDLYAQMIPPLAMALATWLIYLLLRDRIGNRAAAMAGAVVFRATPHALTYSIWASDYPLAILYTVVLFYAGQIFMRNRNKSCLEVMMLAVAVAPHINYLMWVLWAPFILYLFAKPMSRAMSYGVSMFRTGMRQRLFEVPPLWVLVFVAAAFLLGIPWYLRNEIVTGNPVYAFFPEIFGGDNINRDVLKSCFQEWQANGEGIGRLAQAIWGADFTSTWDAFAKRLAVTPLFLFWFAPSYFHLSPLFMILGLPGIVLAIRRGGILGLGAVLLIAILWAYECYSGLYLYQILIIVVPLTIAGALVFIELRHPGPRGAFLILCLLIGIFPGLAFSLAGAGKTKHLNADFLSRSFAGDQNFMFYEKAFSGGGEAPMFRYFKKTFSATNTVVLTHENRRHCFPENVKLIHLDDCEVQNYYDLSLPQVIQGLRSLGVEYYLYVPNEDNHPVVKRLGLWTTPPDPQEESQPDPLYFELVEKFGDYMLYRIRV